MPQENYEERKAERIERYEGYADNAAARSTERYKRSCEILDPIPMGQPILIGHHSEKRHRAALKRADNAMRRSCEERDKAEYWDQRAKSAAKNRAISKHDPEAIVKLNEKIAQAEKLQGAMKAANQIVRRKPKNEQTPEKVQALVSLGFSEPRAVKLFGKDFAGRFGFPAYALQNNNANIRRMKQRVETLERERGRDEVSEDLANGAEVRENGEWDSTEIHFPGKPSEQLRSKMKAHGWQWARRSGCWYRKRRDDHTLAFAREIAAEYTAE